MKTFEIIKSTTFEANNAKHQAITVSYKGRALNFSTLNFAKDEYEVKDKQLIIKTDIVCKQQSYVDDSTGETKTGLRIMPVFDLEIVND